MGLFKRIKKQSTHQQQLAAIAASLALIRKLYQTGDYLATVIACDQALTSGLTTEEIYLTRGLAKCKLGDLSGAGQDMKQAVALGRK